MESPFPRRQSYVPLLFAKEKFLRIRPRNLYSDFPTTYFLSLILIRFLDNNVSLWDNKE